MGIIMSMRLCGSCIDYFFISFGIIEPILVTLNIKYRLPVLRVYIASQPASIYINIFKKKTESLIFVLLCLLVSKDNLFLHREEDSKSHGQVNENGNYTLMPVQSRVQFSG